MKRKKNLYLYRFCMFGICLAASVTAVSVWRRTAVPEEDEDFQESRGAAYIALMETKDVGEALAVIYSKEESREALEQSIAQSIAMEQEASQSEAELEKASIEESIRQSEAQEAWEQQRKDWKQQLEENNVVSLTEEQLNSCRSQLKDCVVLGDSMAQAALEYGFLDAAHVVYRRSYTVDRLTEAADVAAGLYPANIIFFTGLNDCNHFAMVEDYIASYEALLDHIRTKLPQVKFYICSLLPPNDVVKASRSDLARSEQFDQALKQMCERRGDTYVDTNWMVYQHLYLKDGIHFNRGFYEIWVQYMAAQIQREM